MNFFSNKTERLYEHLKSCLFQPGTSPFARRLLVVPSPAMKSWLTMRMANDSDLGIAMGVETCYPEQALNKIFSLVDPQNSLKQLNAFELSIEIEKELRKTILDRSQIDLEQLTLWSPLFKYLKIESPGQMEKRITSLSELLAALFSKYGKYGGSLPLDWDCSEPCDWQEQLWKQIYQKWNYPIRAVSEVINQPLTIAKNVELHLFAISHLPKFYHELLQKLSDSVPVYHYILSPCQLFWDDIESDRDRFKLDRFWRKKGASEQQVTQLAEYLENRNPLLANLGKLGKETMRYLESAHLEMHEDYTILKSALENPVYQSLANSDLLLEKDSNPLSALNALQTDILLLRTPDPNSKVEIALNDHSIQMHSAPNRLREIQVLHDQLIGMVQESAIYPGEIIVMSPNINLYAPYIEKVFNAENSPLKAQIFDLAMASQNLSIRAFTHLISIAFSRWESSEILKLFEFKSFQHRHQLGDGDVAKIESWIKDSEIRWGSNSEHRDQLLARSHCTNPMVDKTETGTWENAFLRMFAGLAIDQTEAIDPLPLSTLIESPLLGKFVFLIRSLKSDLQSLNDHTKLSFSSWGDYLKSLFNGYFIADDDAEALFEVIEQFKQIDQKLGSIAVPFSSVRDRLEKMLHRPSETYRDGDPNAIRCCAILPMRAIPAKIIALIGMDEEAYPRNEIPLSLNLIAKSSKADYSPSQSDYDRFLFLEALLSAREFFYVSFCGYNQTDGKEQSPSLLIYELISYMELSFQYKKPFLQEHPYHPFDKSYFVEGSPFKSYSQKHFCEAVAFYKKDQIEHEPIVDYSFKENPAQVIALKDLVALARDPLKLFFNKRLGIFIETADKRTISCDEKFHLSGLDQHLLKKESLKLSIDTLFKEGERKGKLPVGPFKQSMIEKMRLEIEQSKRTLQEQGIDIDQLFEITLSRKFLEPNMEKMQFPALAINLNGSSFFIEGQIKKVSKKGLVIEQKLQKSDVTKSWPEYLLLNCLIKQYHLDISPELYFVKGTDIRKVSPFFSEPHQLLSDYLDYYFAALEQPSPLLPEVIPNLLRQEKADIETVLEKTFSEYLKFVGRDCNIPKMEISISDWQPRARKLFEQIYSCWFKR